MTELKTKTQRVKKSEVLFIDKFPTSRWYLVSFVVVMGTSYYKTTTKFTRATSVPYSSDLTGEHFLKDLRKFCVAYAMTHFVKSEAEGKVEVLVLSHLTWQEAPRL
jgi:hypothetical protein